MNDNALHCQDYKLFLSLTHFPSRLGTTCGHDHFVFHCPAAVVFARRDTRRLRGGPVSLRSKMAAAVDAVSILH